MQFRIILDVSVKTGLTASISWQDGRPFLPVESTISMQCVRWGTSQALPKDKVESPAAHPQLLQGVSLGSSQLGPSLRLPLAEESPLHPKVMTCLLPGWLHRMTSQCKGVKSRSFDSLGTELACLASCGVLCREGVAEALVGALNGSTSSLPSPASFPLRGVVVSKHPSILHTSVSQFAF